MFLLLLLIQMVYFTSTHPQIKLTIIWWLSDGLLQMKFMITSSLSKTNNKQDIQLFLAKDSITTYIVK